MAIPPHLMRAVWQQLHVMWAWARTLSSSDVFDVDVYPAVSADEGMRIGSEVFPRLLRIQQQT
jgi:hypothetical protein